MYAQNETDLQLNYNKEEIKISRFLTKKPQLLVEALIKNKKTDKEKFDAIFAWVATNIDYNYTLYFSSGGAGKPDVKRILKYRKGICVDYAFLMDTLCKLANLSNVSIYGYAKDEIFDVSDSLYIDNHAWNAVKLNNLWYVYDVTFSTGKKIYDYTRFSKFLIRIWNKLPVKHVRKTVNEHLSGFCGDTTITFSYDYKIYKRRLIRKILSKFKLKIISKYKEILNTDYYLCNPELFAVTHFPDNPIWSLVAEKKIREFECDSQYYHLEDTLYKIQNRIGRPCSACDNSLSYDELSKQKYERDQSLSLNKKNSFYPAICEYYIGAIKYNESKKEEDSLSKVTLLDTSIAHLENSKNNFYKAHTNIEIDYGLQRDKNRRKYYFLYDDNKKHLAFINNKVDQTYKERRNAKELEHRTTMNSRSYKRRIGLIGNYKTNGKRSKGLINESLIFQCKQKLEKDTMEIDSLNKIIGVLKTDFEKTIKFLANNIWLEVYHHDSLLTPFKESINYREFGYDDYKKKTVEVRKKIRNYENRYSKHIDSLVYLPSKYSLQTATLMFKLIDRKNNLEKECFQTKLRLVKLGDLNPKELINYQAQLISYNKENYCWLTRRFTYLHLTYKGFNSLKQRQELVRKTIRAENAVEYGRFKAVNKELLRRRRKYKSISVNNTRFVKKGSAQVKKYKSDYLSYLRKLRREAKRKVK